MGLEPEGMPGVLASESAPAELPSSTDDDSADDGADNDNGADDDSESQASRCVCCHCNEKGVQQEALSALPMPYGHGAR